VTTTNAVNVSVALVVAIADNGVIGRDGGLPWSLPDDLKHFKAVTLGKPVLMGRRTFESIGKPLPGRRNLVMSREPPQGAAGIEYVQSVEAARQLVCGVQELCVIGGAQIFALALALTTRIYLTRVHASIHGDVYFPLTFWEGWREAERIEHPADTRHAQAMSFLRLERR